ncbi:MAG: AI-2E family transporter [Pseudomonadota bacterium]
MQITKQNPVSLPQLASYILIALSLLLILRQGLLAALFAGLLVYSLVHMTAPLLTKRMSSANAKMFAVAVLGTVLIAALTLAIWGLISFFRSDAGNLETLLQKLADIIDASRDHAPLWVQQWLPADADALRILITGWLRDHSVEAKTVGADALRTAAHILIGMIIGAMGALHTPAKQASAPPLGAALYSRIANLRIAFENVVFAQVRISAINTVVSAVFLFIALPMAGIHLPLSKSLVAITFLAGLIPVAGNLISNTVLVIISLSHSVQLALVSLSFMIVIHKLEYFLNARIIGSHINARAWEILLAMLIMESVFGVAGVIAAPVLYALLKMELTALRLV